MTDDRSYVVIPPGTAAVPCRSCRKRVYWITTKLGRPMPVSVDGWPFGRAPTASEPGAGVAHFADCPDALHWRRGRAKAKG